MRTKLKEKAAGNAEAPAPDYEGQLIGEFQKNATERVRVGLKEYRGMALVDVRVFYQNDAGEMKPSGKGVCIRQDLIPELRRILTDAEKAAGLPADD